MVAMALLIKDKLYYRELADNETITIGSDNTCEMPVQGLKKKICVTWQNNRAQITVIGSGKLFKSKSNDIKTAKLSDLTWLDGDDDDEQIGVLFSPVSQSITRVNLDTNKKITVRRHENTIKDPFENRIIVNLPFISTRHMEFIPQNGKWFVRDTGSTNGTFVNGERVTHKEIFPGDVISVFTFRIVHDGNALAFFNDENTLAVKITEKMKKSGSTAYPWFDRRESVGIQLKKDPFVIEKLPEIGATPTINWVQVLAAPIAMLTLACGMMAAGMGNMFMMAIMQLVGVVTAVVSHYTQKRKFNQNSKDRSSMYKEYLAEIEEKLEKIAQTQRKVLWETNPAGATCLDIVRSRKPILWSRDSQSRDFLEISLGVGESELSCPINVHRPGRFDKDVNELSLRAVALADKYEKIQGVPITFSLQQNNAIAVVGTREHRTAMLQQMLISLSTLHTPEELKIAIVYSKEEAADWSFFRFLPHVWDANKTTRYLADDAEGIDALLNHFANMAEERQKAAKEYHATMPTPFYILVITDPRYMNRITNAERLLPKSPVQGMTTLIATGGSLPSGCRHVIEVHGDDLGALQGNAYPTSDQNQITHFTPISLSRDKVEEIVRAMAPVRLRSGKEGKGLPSFISLFKGRKVNAAKEMRIEESWNRYRAVDSMAVSLGVGSDGKELIFDIHEKRDGPMGLVAGTTRAGKTELLQTWIVQMASKFSPEDVNFVLFDFKGSSLIDPLKDLPHLVGDVSNIGPDESGQDFELRYCAALNSEIIRRQKLLALTESTNILDYQKKFHNHQVTEPMPFLMIILDEFARIKSDHPDFMKLANSLYATGGSLGMYVILSTQNPASAITPEIRANSAFQLCARVAESQDSREMIDVPDAAFLPKIPGRAFLRVRAQGTLQCFQSYYSGAAYDAKTQKSENAMPTALIEVNGNARTVKAAKSDFTELEATVAYICQAANALRIPAAHKVWLPPLEKKISIYDILRVRPGEESLREKAPDLLTAIVGVTDDPARQAQYATELNFAQYGNALVCGGPGVGKTTFLLSTAVSLAHLYAPERLRMYFLDGGGGGLNSMEKFPHTARMLNAQMQPEECMKILAQLRNEVKTRQQKLAARGVYDTQSYRKLTGEIIADILLTIDDVGELRKSLEEIKSGDALETLAYLMKFGPATGIYLLISAFKQQDLYKIGDNIRHEMRFVMGMDKSDAREMLGLTTYPPVLTTRGRGVCIGTSGEKRPLVFQTALPWTVDDTALQVTELQKLGQEMADRCGVAFDDQPKVVPAHIPYGSIPCPEEGLALGLALSGGDVVSCYGNPDSSALTLVGADAAERLGVAAMITKQAALSGRYEKTFEINEIENAASVIEELREEVLANMSNGIAQKKYFLVVHDFPEVYCGLSDTHRTLLDKFALLGGTKFGVDCLFGAAPKQLAQLPENDGGVVSANTTLFRRPMLYLDAAVAKSNACFETMEQNDQPMGPEDAEFVEGFEDARRAVRIRRMLNR